MQQHTLILTAYDISDPKTLRRACRLLRKHSLDRQKSVFECPFDAALQHAVAKDLAALIDPQSDCVLFAGLDRQHPVITLGHRRTLADNLLLID